MEIFLWILSLVGAFSVMEFMAWFTHKYIMHGFLWYLHEDHHKKDHDSWFERNDTFFLFYARAIIIKRGRPSCLQIGISGPKVQLLRAHHMGQDVDALLWVASG